MVVRMHEKPAAPPSTLACPPLYFFLPAVWEELAAYLADPQHNHDAPGWFIEHLCHHARVRALEPASGSRIDIGSIDDYQRACAMFSTDNLNTT